MSTPPIVQVGAEIRRARYAAGLTQRELARRMSVDVTFVSLLEIDKRQPSLARLSTIAEACQCSFVIDGSGVRTVEGACTVVRL